MKAVYDGGVIADSHLSRLGSTVVDLSVHGSYRIIRAGCAHRRTVDILQSHGLTDLVAQ